MEIKILGAHNQETATTRLTSLLIDDVLAVDAGSLTSSLSLSAQQRIESILLTHRHYDHIRDVATIALNFHMQRTIKVYAIADTLNALSTHIINGEIYPKFAESPSPERATLKLLTLKPYQPESIDGYRVLPVPISHGVPTVGYQITSEDGRSVFYSSDTGPGLSASWEHVSPNLLIIEATLPNRFEEYALDSQHLTPRLLKRELAEFQKLKGYLPPVVIVHMVAPFEGEIRDEIAQLARELDANINPGYEGMKVEV